MYRRPPAAWKIQVIAASVPRERAPFHRLRRTPHRTAAITLSLALASAALAGAAPADLLWLKAVESASRVREWSPGEMRLAMEMADDKRKVLETWDYRYRLSAGEGEGVQTEVVSAFHNGKDETQKEREAQAKRERDAKPDGGADWTAYLDDPFAPAMQDAVDIRPLAGTSVIAGTTCAAFTFTLSKPKNMAVAGTAWLDAVTGLPVELVSSPKPLPRAVHDLVTTVRYADGFVSEVRIEGSGSLLFFKRRFVSVVTLGGWFRSGALASTAGADGPAVRGSGGPSGPGRP